VAEVKHRDPVADAHHELHVVVDQQDGQPVLVEAFDQLANTLLLGRVHARRRLVEDEKPGLERECAGDLQPALVAVRQRARRAAADLGRIQTRLLHEAVCLVQARPLIATEGRKRSDLGEGVVVAP
jgi:hypothetical protein